MLCNKCGKEFEESAQFCDVCGEKLQPSNESKYAEIPPENAASVQPVQTEIPEEAPASAETRFQPMEPAESPASAETNLQPVESAEASAVDAPAFAEKAPKKKKLVKGIIAAVISLVVIAAGVFASACIFPTFRHTLLKTFLSPADYFKYVASENLKDAADGFGDSIDIFKAAYTDSTTDGSFTIKMGDGLKEYIKETDRTVYNAISWINTLGGDIKTTTLGSKNSFSMGLELNDTYITTLDMIIDYASGHGYFAYPDLNPDYISVNFPVTTASPNETANEFIQSLPDKKAAQNMFKRYITCIFKQIKKGTKSNETLEAEGLSVKTTKLSMKIDEKTASKILVAVMKEAKKDNDLKDLIYSFAKTEPAIDADEVYESFINGIDEAIRELESIKHYSKSSFDFNIWVDAKGKILAWGFDVAGNEIKCASFTKDKTSVLDFSIGEGFEAISFSGSVKETDNMLNGGYSLSAGGVSLFKINVSDVDAKRYEEGLFSGTVTFELSKLFSNMLPEMSGPVDEFIRDGKLEFYADTPSLEGPVTERLAFYVDDELWLSLETTSTRIETETITIPENSYSFDGEEFPMEWVAGCDITKITENLSKAGFPQEWLAFLTAPSVPEEVEETEDESVTVIE